MKRWDPSQARKLKGAQDLLKEKDEFMIELEPKEINSGKKKEKGKDKEKEAEQDAEKDKENDLL